MKKTIKDIMAMKNNEPVTMLTAYDYYSAYLAREAGIDLLLVGDSLGMVFQGRDNTLPVTVAEMIYHTEAVKRGAPDSLVVTDMPFMSYQSGVEKALENAGKIIKQSEANAVKLEGGERIIPQVKALIEAGIPVVGHLGLTPQSVNQFGGFKVQGQDKEKARELLEDALALEEAGIFSLVLETVPRQLAALVTEKLTIPVIGIGAGPDCDGQVLVIHDLLGVDDSFQPVFVRRYADLKSIIKQAISNYIDDVKKRDFPADGESFQQDGDYLPELKGDL